MELKFKEKYLIVLIILCFTAIAFYYSYAVFVTKQLQENVVVIKVDNNIFDLKVDGQNKTKVIPANSSSDLHITLSNSHGTSYYYLILVKGLIKGVKISSVDNTKGEIKEFETKELIVHVNNTTNDKIELEFAAKASKDLDIDMDYGYYLINKVDNYDHSGANKPEINGLKLLPVSYKQISDTEGYWYKTDLNNQTDLWYSYENGIWANAVLLNSNNYNKYQKKDLGTEIELGDIIGFYVWIPRFKYYIINNSSYTNYERINNIIFEKNNQSTGTISCSDKISNTLDNHVHSEVCIDNYYNHIYDNLSTYTHPAFKDKNGFWVSKFLMGEGEKVLPNVNILKKNTIDADKISRNYSNSHVLTNMEYGAVILLSNSLFGKTGNSIYGYQEGISFSRIYANTYQYEMTGCSSEYNIHSNGFITELSKKCTEYNDLTNYSHISNSINYPIGYAGAGASSTGTIYGVYDLTSSFGEMVFGFVADKEGNISFEPNYHDVYSYNEYVGSISSSSNVYNLYRYKLGDAIKEHYRSFTENGMWANGILNQKNNTGILVRGFNNSVYSASIEDPNNSFPFRLALLS